MLRPANCALAAEADATVGCLIILIFTGGSAEDIAGFGVLCFASSLALALFLYVPGFTMIRRRHWNRRAAILLTITLLNAPAYVVLLAGAWRGGMFGDGPRSRYSQPPTRCAVSRLSFA